MSYVSSRKKGMLSVIQTGFLFYEENIIGSLSKQKMRGITLQPNITKCLEKYWTDNDFEL